MVNAVYDRQSSTGAWEYTIPKDADAMTTNWDTFIEATAKMEFDAKNSSGGERIKKWAQVWQEICLCTY